MVALVRDRNVESKYPKQQPLEWSLFVSRFIWSAILYWSAGWNHPAPRLHCRRHLQSQDPNQIMWWDRWHYCRHVQLTWCTQQEEQEEWLWMTMQMQKGRSNQKGNLTPRRESHIQGISFDLFSKKQNCGTVLISIGYFFGLLQNCSSFAFWQWPTIRPVKLKKKINSEFWFLIFVTIRVGLRRLSPRLSADSPKHSSSV